MKRLFLVGAAAIGLAFVLLTAGCASWFRPAAVARSQPRAFALAVTVQGGLQPTPMQWAAIQAKFSAACAARGWVLVNDLALADEIIRVDFQPNPDDPENSGRLTVLGYRANPRNAIASSNTWSAYGTGLNYGFAPGFPGNYYSGYNYGNYSGYNYGYYSGYNYGYYDGYGYAGGSSTRVVAPVTPTTPTPTTPTHTRPPHRYDPTHPGYCPPRTTERPPDFVSDHPRRPIPPANDTGIWQPRPSFMRSEPGQSHSRSDSSRSRSDGTYSSNSRSDSTYARSDSSYSSSSSSYDSSSSSSSSSGSYSNSSDSGGYSSSAGASSSSHAGAARP